MKWAVKYTVDGTDERKTEQQLIIIIDAKEIREAARVAHAVVVRKLKQQPGVKDVMICGLEMWEPA